MFYGSAAEFRTYHASRGRTISEDWSDAAIEAALLVASEWLDNIYGDEFVGWKTDGFDQEREWPRESAATDTYPQKVFTTTEIPDRVEQATYEAAWREMNSTGSLNVDFTPNKYNKAAVDGAVSVEYAQNLTLNDSQVQIRVVKALIKPLLDPQKAAASSTLSGSVSRQ